MFLNVHAAAGALVGGWTGHPAAAFALGVLSHIVLDIIPHGDEHIAPPCQGPTCTHHEEIRFLSRLAAIDGIVMCGVLIVILRPWVGLPSMTVIAGIAGAVVPDILQGLGTVFSKSPLLVRIKNIHDFFHCHIIRYESPVAVGMCTQVIALVALIFAFR